MTYGRLSNPRFYMDNLNWRFSRGLSRDDTLSVLGGAGNIGIDSGTKYDMFDMNPLNVTTFETAGETNTVSILIDMGAAGIEHDFISIMNHNMDAAGGKMRVAYSASTMTVGGGTAVSFTEVLNGDVSGDYATPDSDGDTILTFTGSSVRYWLVEFEDISTFTATKLFIGEIVLGKYWTSPVSPDMPVTKGTAFNGVQTRESYGGKRFASAGWLAPNTGGYTPFRGQVESTKAGGRESFDFSLGFMEDTNIYPSNRAFTTASDQFYGDVVNRCGMNMIPFIFAADSSSATPGDYMWGRFGQNTFDATQKAWKVYSFAIRVEQEF